MRSLLVLVGSLVLVFATLGLTAPPASASYTTLCTGWDGCKAAGFSHAGYKSASKKMWWRMYTGHNCTNYVAYRMVKAGMSPNRPWSGTGMAWNFGIANRSRTDATPTVGSVAWWNKNAGGVGSSGHVAYVEQVVSATEIVISEDSWSGDFHWRRITKSGKGWPSGFVHFLDVALTNTGAPAINGAPRVGAALGVSPGSWTPASPTPSYAYQWLAAGAAIPGATGAAFTPTADLVGRPLSVQVTATRPGLAAATAVSAASAPVAAGSLGATSKPAVTGTPQVDAQLTAGPATWSPAATSATVQWQADGVDIPGATGTTLQLGQAQAGRMVRAVLTGSRAGYAASAVASDPVGPILAPPITVQQAFVVHGGSRLGDTVTVDPGRFTPGDAVASYTWLRRGVPIAGATSPTYQLMAADVGTKPTVRVGLSRPGNLDYAKVLRVRSPVTTKASLALATGGKRSRAVVIVRVSADGVADPGGRLTVQLGRRTGTAKVVGGRATVVLRDLPVGTWKVKVAYGGTRVVARARATGSVTVTR